MKMIHSQPFEGAIDSSVVKNASLINWNHVVDFAPFNTESNTSSYLQWAIPISGFSVRGCSVPIAWVTLILHTGQRHPTRTATNLL